MQGKAGLKCPVADGDTTLPRGLPLDQSEEAKGEGRQRGAGSDSATAADVARDR